MYNAKDRGKKKINRHKPHQSKISTRRKSCCVLVGLQRNCVLWAASAKLND